MTTRQKLTDHLYVEACLKKAQKIDLVHKPAIRSSSQEDIRECTIHQWVDNSYRFKVKL